MSKEIIMRNVPYKFVDFKRNIEALLLYCPKVNWVILHATHGVKIDISASSGRKVFVHATHKIVTEKCLAGLQFAELWYGAI